MITKEELNNLKKLAYLLDKLPREIENLVKIREELNRDLVSTTVDLNIRYYLMDNNRSVRSETTDMEEFPKDIVLDGIKKSIAIKNEELQQAQREFESYKLIKE